MIKINIIKVILLAIELIYIQLGLSLFIYLLPSFFPHNNQIELAVFTNLTTLISKVETFLRLPVWSRNYKRCYDPKSEITCAQLMKAYHTIKEWKSYTAADRPRYAVLHVTPKAGLGNSLYHILTGVLAGIALNRSVHIKSSLDGIMYDDAFVRNENYYCQQFGHIPIRNLEHWQRWTYNQLKTEPCHLNSKFCYPYFVLLDPGFAKFTYEHFGIHFSYYLLNFATPARPEIEQYVFELVSTIPRSVKLIGVHIRTHKKRGNAFINDFSQVERVLFPFLNDLLGSKNYVALATDWSPALDLFSKHYKNRMIITNVERRPDGNKYGAATDVIFLMICNKMLGTYRSSFSAIAAQRACHVAYYLAGEYPTLFQFSNSQVGITSAIYERLYDYNYFASRRMKLNDITEEGIRMFYRNIMF